VFLILDTATIKSELAGGVKAPVTNGAVPYGGVDETQLPISKRVSTGA
jgi:hypothetical protein